MTLTTMFVRDFAVSVAALGWGRVKIATDGLRAF
jgi:hypothetical protein